MGTRLAPSCTAALLLLAALSGCPPASPQTCPGGLGAALTLALDPSGPGRVHEQVRVPASVGGETSEGAARVGFVLEARPPGSATIVLETGDRQAAFVPDVPGRYTLRAEATAPCQAAAVAQVSLEVQDEGVVNRPPTARIQAASLSDTTPVVLDGTGSSDPDGDALLFSWSLASQPPGAAAELRNAHQPTASLVMPKEGPYVVQLLVWDGQATSAVAQVFITMRPSGNTPPIAVLTPNGKAVVGTEVHLSGAGSSDADGDVMTFAWSLIGPAGSFATLRTNGPDAWFTPDATGTYQVRLTVRDGIAASSATSTVEAIPSWPANHAPVAVIGDDTVTLVGRPVSFNLFRSFDPDHTPLTFTWRLAERPAASTTQLLEDATAWVTLRPDVAGRYRIELEVGDGQLTSVAGVVVTAQDTPGGPVRPLDIALTDAEYSAALDRLVTVSSGPDVLKLIDPATGTSQYVALSSHPLAVAVSPDGLTAVVLQAAKLSLVDLSQGALVATMPHSIQDPSDVVLTNGGLAYVMDDWSNGSVWSMNLATKLATQAPLPYSYSSSRTSRLKLHPGGGWLLAAFDDGALQRFDVSQGAVDAGPRTSSPGGYSACGNAWFTQDGGQFITGCGRVFRSERGATSEFANDGALPGVTTVVAAAHSTPAGKLYVIPGGLGPVSSNPLGDDRTFLRYDASALQSEGAFFLGAFPGDAGAVDFHGRYVFARSGDAGFVVVGTPDPYLPPFQSSLWGLQTF